MATTVRTQKALVTKRVKAINDWLEASSPLLTAPSEAERRGRASAVRLALQLCAENSTLLEGSVEKLVSAFEDLTEPTKKDEEQFDKYVDSAHDVIMNLQQRKTALMEMLHSCVESDDVMVGGRFTASETFSPPPLAVSKLPLIPLPNFSGKRWEWDNFWTLFRENVHDQELTELQKFNYLLNSLRGEARQSISRFQVTAANYNRAVEHLKRRYGQREDIVFELHKSLNACVAQGQKMEDQRKLFEKLSSIAAQLKDQGEHLDNYLTIQTFLHKFSGRIQKVATEKRLKLEQETREQTISLAGGPGDHGGSLDWWLNTIDNIITQEEKLKYVLPDEDKGTLSLPKEQKRSIIPCERCNQRGHKWFFCPRLPTPEARRNFLMDKQRCLNCGSSKHRVASCPSEGCRKCNEKHHTAICSKMLGRIERQEPKRGVPQQRAPIRPSTQPAAGKPTKVSKQHVVTSEPLSETEVKGENVVLQLQKESETAQLKRSKVVLLVGTAQVFDSENKLRNATVLLDTGSELSFINSQFACELGLPVVETTSLLISTFGAKNPSQKSCDITKLQVCDIEGCQHEVRLHHSEHITSAIEKAELNSDDLDFISTHGIRLSVPEKSIKLKPQILLGCDYLWNFMMPAGKLILPSGLQLIPTKFGYIISGRQADTLPTPTESVRTLTVNVADPEKEKWDQYWSLESSGTQEFTGSKVLEFKQVNEQVLAHFRSSIQRRDDGYYVRLPWKSNCEELPDNKMIALKRLHKVLQMYAHNQATLLQYDGIFKEQREKGIIEEVPYEEVPQGAIVHYLPHQAVITPAKETTKMRIVFDASAHYKDKPCLNDVLHQGPLLLPHMVAILLRFRAHNIAIISDVEKAFLQVRLQEIDRDATRCMWVRDISLPPDPDNVVIYRFTRVTFGLNTSPFLLGATIDFHLDNMTSSSDMAKEIKRNLYVDNLILGATSSEEALDKYHIAKDIFRGLNMNLREFLSNDDHFNRAIKKEDRTKAAQPKVLGVQWNPSKDTLVLKGVMTASQAVTKRTVSRQLASVYDPLGFLVPVLLPAKVFLQSLWKEEYGWDVPLPPNLKEQWRMIASDISTFYKEIDRKITHDVNDTMFVFTDASQFALAACVYMSTRDGAKLVMAKSKLPSLKTAITIPKLEMNALTLGARLAHFVYDSLCYMWKIRQVILYTDSEIVLSWLKSPPDRQTVGVLVTNRLKEVRAIVHDIELRGTDCLFGHVSTKSNPADCATRGMSSDSCQDHFWWKGPPFIQDASMQQEELGKLFPISSAEEEELDMPPASATMGVLLSREESESDEKTLFSLSRHSSLHKAERVVAHVIRFIRRTLTRFPTARRLAIFESIPALQAASSKHELTGPEIREANKCIIKDHQKTMVDEHCVKSQKDLNIKPDREGILRCYGRLKFADIPDSASTPIYIAPRTALARLIIIEAHGQYHRGVSHTMSTVRETYWIPKLRQQVNQITRRCLACQKFNNLPYRYPDMKELPERRVRRTRPFEHIGLDYFGPLVIRSTARDSEKVYGCIFTCATTRLIHLELVEDMSTEKFLNALRRFFARRGVPRTITCDNAPTFILGEQILHDAVERMTEDIRTSRALAKRGIEWIHITPFAPWQGGFYERLIRSIKLSLYKALGKQKVSFDALRTMLIEVEAISNSRPLTYQEERWEQQPLIRPIDFLQRDIELDFPLEYVGCDSADPVYHTPDEARQLATKLQVEKALKSSYTLTEQFWRVWSKKYLTSLREHHRLRMDGKRGTSSTPQDGTVVLLWEPTQPRSAWIIGRIVQIRQDSEGTVREVLVELPNKHRVRRPVNRVIPLEVELAEESGPSENPNQPSQMEVTSEKETPNPEPKTEPLPEQPASVRYNFRKRKQVDYSNGNGEDKSETQPTTYKINVARSLPWILSLLLLWAPGAIAVANSSENHRIQCIEGGVQLTQHQNDPYDVCAETYCLSFPSPLPTEIIKFPPQITVHDYVVKWKIANGQEIDIIEVSCQSTPFCSSIDCTLCVANIANPECWPRAALAGMGLAIYLSLLMCYVFFAVPITLGKPLLKLAQVLGALSLPVVKSSMKIPWNLIRCILRRLRPRRRRRIWSEMAIFLLIVSASSGCQDVNVLYQNTRSCHYTKDSITCSVDTTQVVKINPFKREACLRMTANDSTVLEARLLWEGLQLFCEKETILYTRSTSYELLDSKRCPHLGTCKGEKCAAINRSSLVMELQKANEFPGVTGCVESCGGLGCDCLAPSSGCLFYRIYLVPDNDRVYELYRCNRWKEDVNLLVTLKNGRTAEREFQLRLLPNQPKTISWLTVTLTSLGLPPTPILDNAFISDGVQTAIAPRQYSPPLQCRTWNDAFNMTCEIVEDCTCTPAEVKMLCNCRNVNLTAHLLDKDHRQPRLTPGVVLTTDHSQLIAKIPQLPTAEFILKIQGKFRTTSLISAATCTIENAHCQGCYRCAKGAEAPVTCRSSTPRELAEIQCGEYAFTIPCTEKGSTSILRFYSDIAHFHVNCTVHCGQRKHSFEIAGILRYTGSISMTVRRLIKGESEIFSEFNLPDFGHMMDVFLQWTGTLLLTVLALVLAVIATYVSVSSTLFLRLVKSYLRFQLKIASMFFRLLLLIVCMPCKLLRHNDRRHIKPEEKNL